MYIYMYIYTHIYIYIYISKYGCSYTIIIYKVTIMLFLFIGD